MSCNIVIRGKYSGNGFLPVFFLVWLLTGVKRLSSSGSGESSYKELSISLNRIPWSFSI
ncbi:hypothetical protein LEP1GSC096_0005 [Leptospira interrogans serovar Hebdomadis str. R499]|nr:hypothetical protein LEP1GSC096_0005 [Leptospira interrogans serovar Hebdomadis str. R499]